MLKVIHITEHWNQFKYHTNFKLLYMYFMLISSNLIGQLVGDNFESNTAMSNDIE